MKIDDEIKLRSSDFLYQFHDARDRNEFWPIAQRHAVNAERDVCITRESDDLRARLAHGHRDFRLGKTLPNCTQRRQAQDHVAELAEIDDENVVGIKNHRFSDEEFTEADGGTQSVTFENPLDENHHQQ